MKNLTLFPAIVVALCSCNKWDNSAQTHKYVSTMHHFTVMAPKDPAVFSGVYRFFPADPKALQPLVEVNIGGFPAWYRSGTPPESSLDPIERAYKGETDAVVEAHAITFQGLAGREFAFTAGPRAPKIERYYFRGNLMYTIDFNPNVPGASAVADSFEFVAGQQ